MRLNFESRVTWIDYFLFHFIDFFKEKCEHLGIRYTRSGICRIPKTMLYVQQNHFILNWSRFVKNLIFKTGIDYCISVNSAKYWSITAEIISNRLSPTSFPMSSNTGRITVWCELFPLKKGKLYRLKNLYVSAENGYQLILCILECKLMPSTQATITALFFFNRLQPKIP